MPDITRIFGPPGTGKTTHLINCVSSELENNVRPEQIIYTSFTRMAAREARDRAITKFVNCDPNDFMWFSTIHSICFRLLGLGKDDVFAGRKIAEFCKIHGYEVANSTNNNGEIDTELPEMALQTETDYFEYFINWQRNKLLDFDSAYYHFTGKMDVPDGFNPERLRAYIRRRNDYKTENRLYDFCDMIQEVISQGLMPNDIKVLINDEQQDITPLLGKLLDLWSSRVERVYQAGDPYQCLYSWMAADPSIFINAKADRTVVLKQSYRCPIAVHDLSRKIVNRFNVRYQDDDYTPKNSPGMILRMTQDCIPWDVIKENVYYLHRTRWLLNQAYKDLLFDGVPFATMRGQSPLQTEKATVVLSLLRLIGTQHVSVEDMVKIMDYLPSKTMKEVYLKQGSKAECKRLSHDKPNRKVSFGDLHSLGFTDDFFNYFNIRDILYPFKMSLDEKSYFMRLIQNYGITVFESKPKILLGTIHSVKGGECDTVIINLNLTKKTYDALLNNPDEEHRLFYVATTRSKDKVILVEPENYQSYRL